MLCIFRVWCGTSEYGVDHGGKDNAKKMEESMHKGRFAKPKHRTLHGCGREDANVNFFECWKCVVRR